MAEIPRGEGFGNRTAQPGLYNEAKLPRDAFGQGMAGAMVQAGAMMQQEERQAAAIADAASRARAAASMREVDADLDLIADEVSEGIRTGQIDKTQAGEEFRRRTSERITTGMDSIPTEHQPIAQQNFNTRATRLTRTVNKAVTQRNQQEVREGIQKQLEYTQRLYLTDPAAADQIVSQTIEQLGPFSGLGQAELQKVHQGWKEGTRLNKAQNLVIGARRDNAELDKVMATLEGDEFKDMDPGRKTALLGQIEGFKVANTQKAEAEMRRKQADEERRFRMAESSFNAAQSIITQGKTLSPEYVQQVSSAVQGTPFADAFRETLKQAPEKSAFALQPLAVQRQALDAMRAELTNKGTSPALEKRYAEMQRQHATQEREYKEEPLRAGLEYGLLPEGIAPLNTSNIGTIVQSLEKRVTQSQLVRQQTGSAVSPFLSHEAEQVGRMISILPVEQRASAVAQLSEAMGSDVAAAFGRQVAPKDKALGIALGMSGSKTTAGRYTSELVLRGAQAMKDKAVKPDNTAVTGIRAQIAKEIGDAYPNQELRETMIEAALLAEYGLQSEGSGDVRRAVRLVTGGLAERGGRKVPLPYGMTSDEFDRRIRTMTPANIGAEEVQIAGQKVKATDFLTKLPDAPLIHAGQGRYAVQAGGSIVLRPDGRPLILEINHAR